MSRRVRVWDLPTRFVHWALVLCVIAAFITETIGGAAMPWHGRIGLLILGLVMFRLVWGIVGSTHARFVNFVRGPAAIREYLAGQWRGLGHNPLGALSVLALLALLLAQVGTGLFANDDIAFDGPLASLVERATSNALTHWHHRIKTLLLVVVALHVGAIVYYARVKRDNLVKPMLSGWKDIGDARDDIKADDARGGGMLAFLLALLVAVATVVAASGIWVPAPPPAPAEQAAPAW